MTDRLTGKYPLQLSSIYPSVSLTQLLTLSGVEFSYDFEKTVVAAGASVYIRAIMSSTKYTLISFRQLQMDQERGFYRVYSTFTGGSVLQTIPVRSSRADSAVTAHTVMAEISVPDTLDESSLSLTEPLFGVAGRGVTISSGQVAVSDSFIVIPPNVSLLGVFTNNSVAASYFRLVIRWAEVSARNIPTSEEV